MATPMPQVPATAEEAVQLWDAKQPLAAVKIDPIGSQREYQRRAWEDVFDILRQFPMPSKDTGTDAPARWTYSSAQFDSWCFVKRLAFPSEMLANPPGVVRPDDIQRCTRIRGMAFAILREGYSVVIQRRRALDPGSAITVQKP